MSHSILFAIKLNYKLYVMTYHYHYIIILTNLMAWSEQYQIVQNQYRKS